MVGESGGGCMALLVLQAIIKADLPVPAGAWVIAPMTRNDDAGIAFVSTQQRVKCSSWGSYAASRASHSDAFISQAPS